MSGPFDESDKYFFRRQKEGQMKQSSEPSSRIESLFNKKRLTPFRIIHPFFVTKTKVYLDNCSFTRPYDDQDQTRIHMETLAKWMFRR